MGQSILGQASNHAHPLALVVDDDVLIAAGAAEMFRRLGYETVTANNMYTAVMALDRSIDVLFTDIIMPNYNGFMLADMVKLRQPDVNVVYTTGDTRGAARLKSEAGGEIYGPILQKPYSEKELSAAIRASS